MAFAAPQPFIGASAQQRSTSVCRIHTCVRCKAAIDNQEPCSFVRTELRICGACRGQEQVLRHLPSRPANWSSRLALRIA
jgi:hypothetical protein